jgi:hypothetical protein
MLSLFEKNRRKLNARKVDAAHSQLVASGVL